MACARKCEPRSTVDARQSWSSAAEAADQGAFREWTCPNCAWTEFDLVDESEVAEPATRR